MAMVPAASVVATISPTRKALFALGKIKEDQLQDYAERKNLKLEEARRWLSPIDRC